VFLVVGAGAVLPTQAGAQPVGGALVPEEQKRVNEAIKRGVAYLRRTQLSTGSWIHGGPTHYGMRPDPQAWAVAYAALGALTLLECGADPADPPVQKATWFVR